MNRKSNQKTSKITDLGSGDDRNRKIMFVMAWAAVLIISVPRIVYRNIIPLAPDEPILPMWMAWITAVCIAVLWILTWIWKAIQPLRGFF